MSQESDDYELEDGYDLSQMPIMAKGRYAPGRRAGKNLVVLAPDVAQAFVDNRAIVHWWVMYEKRNQQSQS